MVHVAKLDADIVAGGADDDDDYFATTLVGFLFQI
jgi:hypothetical protein